MKKSRKRTIKFLLIVLQILVFLLFSNASRLVYVAGGKNFQSYISNSSYYAIQKVCDEGLDFSKLYFVKTNESGDVVMINTNANLVNLLAKSVAIDCYDHMSNLVKYGYDIPIGAFSGINLLAGHGPKINIKLISTLSVECKIKRTFESAGINQTRQTLSAVIHTELTVFSLLKSREYSDDIEMLLYDNTIVGKVPESYLAVEIIGEGIKKG